MPTSHGSAMSFTRLEHRVLVDGVEEGRVPVEGHPGAAERGGEVEAEPVDVHLLHPVAQRVHHQLQRLRVVEVEAVPGAGEVLEVARRLGSHHVVGQRVEPLEAERRPEVVALAGVVVDDVEQHLDAGAVQRLHHALELVHHVEWTGAGVARVGREVAERVVAPVVGQPLGLEEPLVHRLLHREELHRGDAEPLEVVDDRRVGEAAVGPAEVLRDIGVAHGEALHVRLVDDEARPDDARALHALPVEAAIHHDAPRHAGSAVAVVEGEVRPPAPHAVGVDRGVEVHPAVDGTGVGVDQELVGVEAQTARGIVRSVGAQAVERSRAHAPEIAVAHVARLLGERDARALAIGVPDVVEADVDALCPFREDGDVDPLPVPRGAERLRFSGPDGGGDRHSTASRTATGNSVNSGPRASPPSSGCTRTPVTTFRNRRPARSGGRRMRVEP